MLRAINGASLLKAFTFFKSGLPAHTKLDSFCLSLSSLRYLSPVGFMEDIWSLSLIWFRIMALV
jgi:hypothetical protein